MIEAFRLKTFEGSQKITHSGKVYNINYFYTHNYVVVFTSQADHKNDSINKPLPNIYSDRDLYIIELVYDSKDTTAEGHAVTYYQKFTKKPPQFLYGLHF